MRRPPADQLKPILKELWIDLVVFVGCLASTGYAIPELLRGNWWHQTAGLALGLFWLAAALERGNYLRKQRP